MRPFPMLAYSYLRFSFSEQAKGDSIRRQVAMREDYLQRKGLTLDTSFTLPPDKGKSAFRGKHRTTGNLSLFLDAVKRGRIKRGSLLLVENLDRLTREEAGEALNLFQSILSHGITVVTLSPEMEFAPGQMDFGRWVIALAEMCRGHSESLAKSNRAKANWEQKRTKIEDGPMTLRRPSWIDVEDPDYKAHKVPLKYVVNQKKAKTVRLIFKLAAEGYGISAIAKKLNREKVPTISKAAHWFDSYVYKVLTNRAVVGEYQPNKRDADHKLVPVGKPVANYFPTIVTEAEWAKARTAIRSRKKSGGRVTSDVNNLFTGIVKTPDGVSYSLRQRNTHEYLVQNTIGMGLTKLVNSIPYKHFETVLLHWLSELKLEFGDSDPADDLEAQKKELEATITELEAGIRKGGKSVGRLMAILEEKEVELEQVEEALQVAMIPKANQFSHTQDLIRILEECPADERESIRRQLKQQIRFLVKRIEVVTEGVPRNPNKKHFLTVQFSDGHTRYVWFETGKKGVKDHGLWMMSKGERRPMIAWGKGE